MGGVAILYKESVCTFKRVEIPNPESFEVLAGSARFAGYSSQLLVIGCYLPPTYAPARGSAALNYIRDTVAHLKRTYRSPYIVIAGDFNSWRVEDALEDLLILSRRRSAQQEAPDQLTACFVTSTESGRRSRYPHSKLMTPYRACPVTTGLG